MDTQEQVFWMVYGDRQGAPTMRHATREIAQDEAKRLARFNPGIKFFVLETVAVAEKIDVHLTMIGRRREHPDEIPF